jgi:hypothetical protein
MYHIGVGIWSTEKHYIFVKVKLKKNENWILKKEPLKFDVGYKRELSQL